MNIPQKIVTERLVLKPISLKYAKEINEGLDKEVTRYMFPQPAPLAETIAWVEEKVEQIQENTDFAIVILDKKTEEFIGGGGIHHLDRKNPVLGIWLKKSAHGHHYGREAISGLKKWADENVDYDYLIYDVATANIPSIRVAEYIGGKLEREYQDKNANDEEMDLLEYRIYKDIK